MLRAPPVQALPQEVLSREDGQGPLLPATVLQRESRARRVQALGL